MNEQQLCKALKVHKAKFADELDLAVADFLYSRNVINKNDFDRLNGTQLSDVEKRLRLLDIIPNRDGAATVLLEALKVSKQEYLVNILTKDSIDDDDIIKDLQKKLKHDIQIDAQNVRQTWGDFLRVTDLKEVAQQLIVIETNQSRAIDKDMRTIYDYAYLTDPTKRIYLIEGDPGIGKTTYVGKLALDWATDSDKILQEAFDVVFFVKCSRIRSNFIDFIYDTVIEKQYHNSLAAILNSPRTLVILDGYDEALSSVSFTDIISDDFIKVSESTIRVRAKVLITTRGTHVDTIQECRLRIWISLTKYQMPYS